MTEIPVTDNNERGSWFFDSRDTCGACARCGKSDFPSWIYIRTPLAAEGKQASARTAIRQMRGLRCEFHAQACRREGLF
jgi:hypothetical protein